MKICGILVCTFFVCVLQGCQPSAAPPLGPEERKVIAGVVGNLFDMIPEATNVVDTDRLLGYYRESTDLVYVAGGRITRSHEDFAVLMDKQFGAVTSADLRWLDRRVDVLCRDAAVATASFHYEPVLASGDTLRVDGSYSAVYVLRDGEWKIEYSAHTFPQRRP